MAAPQNFRSAFNGFNREDVVNYISYISTKHEHQVNELKTEAEELRTQLAAQSDAARELQGLKAELDVLREAAARQDAEQARLQTELEERSVETEVLREESAAKSEANGKLEKALAERDAQIAALKAELEQAKTSVPQPRKADTASRWTEELNAYRRAESAERRARERVNQMYDQANAALAEASVRVERTAGEVAELVVKVESDLALLRQAIGESENTLADTAMVLGSIRPETD